MTLRRVTRVTSHASRLAPLSPRVVLIVRRRASSSRIHLDHDDTKIEDPIMLIITAQYYFKIYNYIDLPTQYYCASFTFTTMSVNLQQIREAFEHGGASLRPFLLQCLQRLLLLPIDAEETSKTPQEAPRSIEIMDTIASLAVQDCLLPGESALDVLLDVLWVVACGASDSDAQQTILAQLLAALHAEADGASHSSTQNRTHIHDKVVAQFPASLLQASGWISSVEKIDKKLKLFNTQTHYKQFKFNLLAEQTEGYSKYLQLLSKSSFMESDAAVEAVAQLMGSFSLDPVRCMDLILDCMIQQLSVTKTTQSTVSATLLKLLQSFQLLDHLPALLLFKLSANDKNVKIKKPASSTTTDARQAVIFHAMVVLVQHELLSAHAMFHYLLSVWQKKQQSDTKDGASTVNKSLEDVYNDVYKQRKQAVRDMGKVKLLSSASSSNVGDGDTAKATEVVGGSSHDLETLQASEAMQFLQAFFDHKQGGMLIMNTNGVILEAEEWSQLSFLFPETIGVSILDAVQLEIEPLLPSTCRAPWSTTDTEGCTPMDVDNHQINETLSVQQLEDFVNKISIPLLYTRESGCIYLRPLVYTQLCRVLASQLRPSNPLPESVFAFYKTFLLPSLSLFSANPTMAHEAWAVMKHLPYQTRYSLYDSWRGLGLERAGLSDPNKPLWLSEAEFQAGKDVRYALKRLSKDTIRDMSRHLAKVTHTHPLIVFTLILGQIESYDNLVQVMVDALRFVTPLGLDVLSSCILNRLSESKAVDGANRSRLKEDGLNVSQWLQSLESFIGYFYKQFPFVDFQGLLYYLMNRLKDGHVMELGVLRTLLKTSAGWSFADYAPAASLSAQQLMGLSGSNALKRETMSFGIVDDINARASKEIRRVLQSDNMGICLLILLAQVRNHILFGKTSKTAGRPKPVKLVAFLLDSCQVTMSILLDFLSISESENAIEGSPIHSYAQSLPTLQELHRKYGLDAATSWMFCRPLIRVVSKHLEEAKDTADLGVFQRFYLNEACRLDQEAMAPPKAWDYINMDLFEVFFSNGLYDIYWPKDLYIAEIARLEKESERLAQQKTIIPHYLHPGAAPQRSEEADKERVKNTILLLTQDMAKQKEHVSSICQTIELKSDSFFKDELVYSETTSSILMSCIYPRCMQSPDDAMYCAHFISLLHKENTPGFGTLHLFDSIITSMCRTLFCLTEGEAANLSILLLEVWKVVSSWRYNEQAFEVEVAGKHGSFMREDGNLQQISYQDFEGLYNKWHASIGSVAIGALKSSQYIHTRNSLILLTRLVSEFPTRPALGYKLIKTLEPLADENKNSFADIRASAAAYSQQLTRARDDGVWKEESSAAIAARQKKNEAVAIARQKQAELQMEEIKLESEKIGKELGPDRRGGDRRRDGRGGGDIRDRRAPLSNFEPPPSRPGDGDRRTPAGSGRHDDRRATRERVPLGATDRAQASGADNRGPPPVRSEFSTMAVGESSRNIGDRFQRPDADRDNRGKAGTKRSRTDSPEEGESTRDEEHTAKRSRTDDRGRDGGPRGYRRNKRGGAKDR